MPMTDSTKVATSLVRDARWLLRRAEKLASAVAAIDDTSASDAAAEIRDAADRLVHQLVAAQQREQHRARAAIRDAAR
jgi:hypothetical protein